MRKQNRFLLLLLTLVFFFAVLMLFWQRPPVTSALLSNRFLNYVLGFVLSLSGVAALGFIIGLGLSSREDRLIYLNFLKVQGVVTPIKAKKRTLDPQQNWRRFGWIAAAVPVAMTAIYKAFSLPGTAVFSFRFGDWVLTLILAAVFALAIEILFRWTIFTVGSSVGVKTGAVMTFSIIFSGLLGYYFPLLGGVFGLIIGVTQGVLTAKSIADTRGLFWAWFIGFTQMFVMLLFSVVTS